ncbi:MAG: hypothetical protein ACE5G0_09465 [Rhodothermales bacterium]
MKSQMYYDRCLVSFSPLIVLLALAFGMGSLVSPVQAQRTIQGRQGRTTTELQRINNASFQVYGWPGTQRQLAAAIGGKATITEHAGRAEGNYYDVSNHSGLSASLARVTWAGMRMGSVPRYGVDGSGDPGPLTPMQTEAYRHLFLALNIASKLPPKPRDPNDPVPPWAVERLDVTGLNPAPDGGGYPEDGGGVTPGDKMCKYLVCVPAVCGQPPFPPDGDLIDCKDLEDELERLREKYEYWQNQAEFWEETWKYIDLAIKGKATAESGAQVAQMAMALGMILAPEPASTAAGVAVAGTVMVDFTVGQLMDALGLCWGADCALQTSLAEAKKKWDDAANRARSYKNGMNDIGQQLADCLRQAAMNNPQLQAQIEAYNQARAAYDDCVENQVCEWKSRRCNQ